MKGSNPWSAYASPFPKYIWAGIFITVPLSAIVLHLLLKFSMESDARPTTLVDSLWYISVITLWDSVTLKKPSLSVMLVYFLLISLYFGEYAAHVIAPKYRTPPIDSLDQLWETDHKWVSGFAENYDSWYKYFGHISDIKKRHDSNVTLLKNEPPPVSALRKVGANPETGFISMTLTM